MTEKPAAGRTERIRPEDAPGDLVAIGIDAWSANSASRPGNWSAEKQVRAIIAAIIPAIRAQALADVRADLRDRIRDALHTINPDCVAYHAPDCIDCTMRADTVMAEMQAELDAKERLNDIREEGRDL